MKILVVSLLRLGDIIQQASLLRGLRAQYPEAEVHLLINQQFAHVQEIIPGLVDKYIYFDRVAYQKGLGESAYNILWSYRKIEQLVQEINQNKYDIAFNFTHTKLSAFLLGATQIRQVRGLYRFEGRFQGLNNRWLKYFNERFSGEERSLFHYIELLGHAMQIPVARAPAREMGKSKSKLILFQCLTSSSKKNWGLQNFRALKSIVESSLPDYEVRILGAAFEKEELMYVFKEEELLICDLAEAREHLQRAALLVTGDTSIKHLAAQLGIRIVELSLGSSDASKTSAYSLSTQILQSKASCAPCKHSTPCQMQSHLCAEDLKPQRVFEAVWDQLTGVVQTPETFIQQMDRAVWSIYLDGDSSVLAYEYRAREMRQKMSLQEINKNLRSWDLITDQMNKWIDKAKKSLPDPSILQNKRHFKSADAGELILLAQEILKSKMDSAGYFQDLIGALLSRYTQPIQIYERVSKAIQEIEALLETRQTLTQILQLPSMEGPYYAKGIGKISIDGFTEVGESQRQPTEQAGILPRDRENSAS